MERPLERDDLVGPGANVERKSRVERLEVQETYGGCDLSESVLEFLTDEGPIGHHTVPHPLLESIKSWLIGGDSPDIFYARFSTRTRAIIDSLGTIIFLFPIGLFFFISSLDYVSFSWSLKEGSAQPGGLPGVFVLKTLIPVMAFLLLLQGLAELGRLTMIITHNDEQA